MSKILIVDDNEVNRYIRREILTRGGYTVAEVSNGEAAMRACAELKPDLVLLDIHLPDTNGFEVCRMIKTNPETASIMVMQISASAVELRDAVTGLDGGADDFLIEPTEPELLLAKVRSILRLRTAEDQLRRSNRDLTQFAFTASHDLQEPLRMMVISAQLLEREYSAQLDEKGRRYTSQIVDAGRRMSALVRDLLEYSRVSTTSDDDIQPVDLGKVLEQTRDWVKVRLEEASGTIDADALPVIEGSEVRLAQVFRNLIENSIKYRRPDVPLQVKIGATPRDRDWVFTITDNGQGFDPSYNREIFEVFRRVGNRDVTGSGIGLSICRTIVESAGGRIWAEGRPDEGATFYISWPARVSSTASSWN